MFASPCVGRFRAKLVLAAVCCAISSSLVAVEQQEPIAPSSASDVRAVERDLLERANGNIERYRKGDVTIRVRAQQDRPLSRAKVSVRQREHEFLVGCIIFDLVWDPNPHNPELYRERFRDLFNLAVFPFYWARYESQPNQTMRAKTLETVEWCRENGITTKGHPLVWTNRSGVPKWVQELSPEESEQRLLGRVRREVSEFSNQIEIWDVVNEPVHCRTWGNVKARDYIEEPIGPIADYVDKAFRAAHEANPDACLVLNEYYMITQTKVRERFVQLVQELQRRGTPLSGLGIQAHEPRQEWYPPKDVLATFDQLASLGLPLHITEFTPQSGGKDITGGWRKGQWNETTQLEFTEQMLRLSFGHPSVVSFNFWGLSDRRAWLPGGGVVTEQYEPKPVYRRLQKLLPEEWNTSCDLTTDQQGAAAFRGFAGKYSIAIDAEGQKHQTFEAVLSKDQANEWVFTLAE